jgi:hypothetical protein
MLLIKGLEGDMTEDTRSKRGPRESAKNTSRFMQVTAWKHAMQRDRGHYDQETDVSMKDSTSARDITKGCRAVQMQCDTIQTGDCNANLLPEESCCIRSEWVMSMPVLLGSTLSGNHFRTSRTA